MLTPSDEAMLLKWHKDDLDIEKHVLPVLKRKAKAYMEKNGQMPANPLCYFDAAVREEAEKRGNPRK
jgi:hypothetical protein